MEEMPGRAETLKRKRNEDNLRDLQDNIKHYNIWIIGVPEEEDKKKDHEKILEHQVSVSISLPSRGSFHLSLTVLFAIGHVVVFSLWGWSPFLPSGFLVSRRTPDSASLTLHFVYRVVTFFDLPFQVIRLWIMILLLRSLPRLNYSNGLGCSDFARHYSRNHFCFLFLRVLRCFSSPGSPCITIYSLCNNAMLFALSSLIRISTDL